MHKLSSLPHILPSRSFSIHSLADGSEIISETEELKAIKYFRDKALREVANRNFPAALQLLNEALEIDDRNVPVLKIHAQVLLEIENLNGALRDLDRLSAINPDSPEVKTLEGLLLEKSGKFEEAMLSHIKCLPRATAREQMEIRDRLVENARSLFELPEEKKDSLAGQDLSACLVELGMLAMEQDLAQLSLRLLSAAQPLIGAQLGLRMRSLLALAHAHSALGQRERALVAYQDCLASATEASDLRYQVKALVSLASLHHSQNDHCQAILHYERLLDLKASCQAMPLSREDTLLSLPGLASRGAADDPGQTVWPFSLELGIHANLALAYKASGDLSRARRHSSEQLRLLGETPEDAAAVADAHWLAGELAEAVGALPEAARHFDACVAALKKAGASRARAYGRLGGVWASLRHAKLAEIFHVQHVVGVDCGSGGEAEDWRQCGAAWCAMGESFLRLARFEEADECFVEFLKFAMKGRETAERVHALGKMGEAYKAAGRHQHALFYFQEAEMYAEEESEGAPVAEQVLLDIQLAMAQILSHSNFVMELETARKYLDRVLPAAERRIRKHREEGTFCPPALFSRMDTALRCLQMVQLRAGGRLDALATADRARKWTWARHVDSLGAEKPQEAAEAKANLSRSMQCLVSGSQALNRLGESQAVFDGAKALDTVRQQEALVVYFSLLDDTLVTWVLRPEAAEAEEQPGRKKKAARRRGGNAASRQAANAVRQQLLETAPKVAAAFAQWRQRLPSTQLRCFAENRCLPTPEEPLLRLQAAYAAKQLPPRPADALTPSSDAPSSSENSAVPAEVRLFELLLEPVQDALTKFRVAFAAKKQNEGLSPALIIVPDPALADCPFHALRSRHGALLVEEWRLTVAPSLFLLSRVLVNELDQAEKLQEVERRRGAVRCGGNLRVAPAGPARPEPFAALDTRRLAHPQLVYGERSEVRQGENADRTGYSSLVPKPKAKAKAKPKLPALRRTEESPRMAQSLTTLTGATSTGTDICRSSLAVPEYRQVGDPDRCVVIGCPDMPETVLLHGREWKPLSPLSKAHAELREVASYLGVDPVDGAAATKERFLALAPSATILHIATWACPQQGCLVFAPNPWRQQPERTGPSAFLVTPADLLAMRLSASLVVLSGGWSPAWRHGAAPSNLLPSLLLLAGAQAVLTLSWAVPEEVLHKFFFRFYAVMQEGATVAEAHKAAVLELRSEPLYADSMFWAPFVLFGKDVFLDINLIRHAQLDQQLDAVLRSCSGPGAPSDPLNLPSKPAKDRGLEKVEKREQLQQHLRRLLEVRLANPDALDEISQLLGSAIQATTPLPTTFCLASVLSADSAAPYRALLTFLGFQISSRGPYEPSEEPLVLLPALSALVQSGAEATRALTELAPEPEVTEALITYLPAHQDSLSFMIDLLSITKHASDLQLKMTDLSVKYLWQEVASKQLLCALGFQQIGPLLHFSRTAINTPLLRAALQLLLSLSTTKSPALLHRLEVNLLGTRSAQSEAPRTRQPLRSLEPRLDAAGHVTLTRPWLTTVERGGEVDAKMALSVQLHEINRKSAKEEERNKGWMASNLRSHAAAAEASYHKAAQRADGAKVKRRSQGGHEGDVPVLRVADAARLRDDVQGFLAERVSGVREKYDAERQRAFLPHCA